ncbi:SNARE associated protein (macronuclear) [Tetrahymena thermophila SB210]|uniref:SNARE associated protein n=1 Tax=Tetrahymena thermophila (strain SB210) TaxID=312017 RepID=I7MLS3_TETTS|nr:SNARE associated protein [Tetrahymena thermophila SB210]EAS02971.1 SNARE associated protein [Tetrahymena thermophila SB210]|eukprot:XP_001023216.1 SNARE associated protein [Tetrahymena thermophila SB210]
METDNLLQKEQDSIQQRNYSDLNRDSSTQLEHQNIPDNHSDTSTARRARDESLHKRILIIAAVIYMMMFLALLIVFAAVEPFRVWYIDLIYQLKENNIQAYVTVFFVGLICLIVGIPIFIIETMIGYIVKPLIYGILLIVAFKMTGLSITFLLGRYIFRDKLRALIQDNEYLEAFSDHASEHPFKIAFFLRVITIFPPILQDYGMGIMKITYKQFFLPVLLSIIIFAIFYAYIGKSIKNIYDNYNSPKKGEEAYKDLAINLLFILFTIIVISYFVKQVQKRLEAAKEETISQVSREEDQHREREIF